VAVCIQNLWNNFITYQNNILQEGSSSADSTSWESYFVSPLLSPFASICGDEITEEERREQ
jgi:hypothetical protein